MKNLLERNTGITLVALVITIIILLILAGVAISMITEGEGLFAKANDAATKYNQAAKNEADLINQLLNGNYLNNGGNGQDEEAEQSYVGYYADLDPEDGKIDGIIFADLAVGGSGEWGTNGNGTYTIPVKTGLKEYYESKESYTVEGFGTKAVLTPKEGSTGEDRFYIMDLVDATIEGPWYNSAYGKMNASDTSVEFGKGRENTAKMIQYWNNKIYGEQNTHSDREKDMWGEIQGKVAEGWFVPSRAEWAAFLQELGITNGNFEDYGLTSLGYWSSSQYDTLSAWTVEFYGVYISTFEVGGPYYGKFARLATTF